MLTKRKVRRARGKAAASKRVEGARAIQAELAPPVGLPIVHRIAEHRGFLVRSSSLGRCIYCGKTTDLTDEHIIPDGLCGDVLFADASCLECAQVTGALEQYVMRRQLIHIRGVLGLKSRKRRRQTRMQTFMVRDGPTEKPVDVPYDKDSPVHFSVPITEPNPGILCGKPKYHQYLYYAQPIATLDAVRRITERVGPGARLEAKFNTDPFLRMLAKIAHGFAYAALVDGTFEPILSSFILGRPGAAGGAYYIGTRTHANIKCHHYMRLLERTVRGVRYLIAEIMMFGLLPTPLYTVVVGPIIADVIRAR